MKKFLCATLLCILIMSGCQQTPVKDVVVNKNNGAFEKSIRETKKTEATAPQFDQAKWEESYQTEGYECKINADIVTSLAEKHPVFQVKKRTFSEDDAKKTLNYFTKDAIGMRATSDTKEELTEKLILAKRGTYVSDDNGGGSWNPNYEGKDQIISELEEQINNAEPEEFSPIDNENLELPMDRIYQLKDLSKLHTYFDDSTIHISTGVYDLVQYESWIIQNGGFPGESGTTINNVKISEEDAANKVYEFLSDLNLGNYGISHQEKARIINDNTYEIKNEGWIFCLSRNEGNYALVDFDQTQTSGVLDFIAEEYSERWENETIKIFVDETGIQSFSWAFPLEIVDTINEDVALLSVPELQEKVKQTIKYGFSWIESATTESKNISIFVDKLVLTGVLLPQQDDLEHQYIAPAWVVLYRYKEQNDLPNNSTFAFAINAVDGSTIDLRMLLRMPE